MLESLVLLALLAPAPQLPDLVISEFQAQNQDTLDDEDGDSPDWIEIGNPTGQSVDLGGWALTDDPQDLLRWTFPAGVTLGPSELLVVFASDKDRRVPGAPLHTNFKLSAKGDYLALVGPDGVVRHEYAPAFPEQLLDVSYGLSRTDSGWTTQEAYFVAPTPGAPNDAGGPGVLHLPQVPNVPALGDLLTISAVVKPARGTAIDQVFLRYRPMYGSNVRVDLHDDGLDGDLVAGDGTYAGQFPASVVNEGEMIRWIVIADDRDGARSTVPPGTQPIGEPQFFGTVVDDPSLVSSLPIYQFFVKDPARIDDNNGTTASFFHAGTFYDNVVVHPRGGSTQGMPKKPLKFNFNRHHHFLWNPDAPKVDEVNFNSTWSDKAYLRQSTCFETYQLADVHSSESFMARLELNGEFYSVAVFIEEPEEEMLERLGMDPDGALYKMYNPCDSTGGVEKKTRNWEGTDDLAALVAGLRLDGEDLERFLFDHVDLPKAISYVAATNLVHDNDHVFKNYFLYRDSDGDGEWEFLPWDKDLTFGRHWSASEGLYSDDMAADDDPLSHPLYGDANKFIGALFRDPRTHAMYVRRFRSLMDELLQTKAVPYAERHFESRFEELYTQILPDVDLDVARWGVPNWGSPMTFREGLDQLIDRHLRPRRTHLFQTHVDLGTIPQKQVQRHVRFGVVEADPASGNQDEEYVEIQNPSDEAMDLSGWTLEGGISFTFAGGSVIPPQDSAFVSPHLPSFRQRASSPTGGEGRLVLGPYRGHLAPNETVQLVDREGVRIADSAGLGLSTGAWVAGSASRLVVHDSVPHAPVAYLYSLAGPGPTDTPLGPLFLTWPFAKILTVPADDAGVAELDLEVPVEAQGFVVYFDAIDLLQAKITNGLEVTIE